MSASDLMDAMPRDHIAERRERNRRDAVRHSRLVRRLRVLLPSLGLGLALILLAAAVVPSFLPAIGLANITLTSEGLVMTSPHLSGHLDQERGYTVTAARAIQSLFDPHKITLEGFEAKLDTGKDRWIKLTGDRARFDTSTEVLVLDDGAQVGSSEGQRASLATATVYLKQGRVVSDQPLTISAPEGSVRAGNLKILDSGKIVRMTGGVHMLIDPAVVNKGKR